MKAPLIVGCDLTSMDSDTINILTNSEVIAVNQDPRGIQGKLIRSPTFETEIWSGPLVDGNVAVILFNRGEQSANITLDWKDMNILSSQSASLRDLWAHKDIGIFTGSYTAEVESHGVVMLRVIPSYCINYPGN